MWEQISINIRVLHCLLFNRAVKSKCLRRSQLKGLLVHDSHLVLKIPFLWHKKICIFSSCEDTQSFFFLSSTYFSSYSRTSPWPATLNTVTQSHPLFFCYFLSRAGISQGVWKPHTVIVLSLVITTLVTLYRLCLSLWICGLSGSRN